MKIKASVKGQHVVFMETAFINGFASGRKIGALEFDPTVFATIEEAVLAAHDLNVVLELQDGEKELCNVIIL